MDFFTSEWLLSIDASIYTVVEKLWGDVMDQIMIFITHLGDDGIFWIVLGVLLCLFKKTRKLGIAALLGLGIVSGMNNLVLKPLFERIRPYDPAMVEHWAKVGFEYIFPFDTSLQPKIETFEGGHYSYSFPSGHTASSIGAAVAMFCVNKKWGIAPVILAVLIGFSRIYLHVHFPSDVIISAIIAAIVGICVYLLVFKAFGKPLDKLNGKLNGKLFDTPCVKK